ERDIAPTPEPRVTSWREDLRTDPDEAYDALIFSERDEWIIRSYFKSNYGNLPPGLAVRSGNLPPGLEKHLHREGSLPPGLQKQAEPLPADLDHQLPGLPNGYSRVVLSGRAMIVSEQGE